jgi:hypothetical protein
LIAMGVFVVLGVLAFSWWRGWLGPGSALVGLLAGLVLASTSVGAPIAVAVRVSATAVGQSLRAGMDGLVR